MGRRIRFVSVAALLAGLASTVVAEPPPAPPPGLPPAAPPETVRALRYRVLTFASGLDFTHGNGRWIEELWFPEPKVVANLATERNGSEERPVVRAFFAEEMRVWAQTNGLETPREQAVEEVHVPQEVAGRLFALAEAERLAAEERQALGPVLLAAKVLRALPDDTEFRRETDAAPPATPGLTLSPAAAAWLSGWAEPSGGDVDPVTRFPKRVKRVKDGGEMVLVPRGPFELGSEASRDAGKESIATPSRSAELTKACYLDVNEVTVGQWRVYAKEPGAVGPSIEPGTSEREPVRNVSHVEATAFARWAGCALPTQGQWERSARANVRFAIFPTDAYHDRVEQRNGAGKEDGHPGVAPVGSFPANGWGFHDLSGNVAEWCADGYGPFPGDDRGRLVGDDVLVDPVGPADAPERVVKGGSYLQAGDRLSIGHRERLPPDARRADVGFRCARTLP